MSKDQMEEFEAEISRSVYKATELLERLEIAGFLVGNGHHMRQAVAKFATDMIRDRWIK